MSYTGVYDKTIYYDQSNKYSVISVKTNDKSVPQNARSAYKHRDRMIRFTAVGYELPQTDRVSMILEGEWQNGKYGPQLQVSSCEEIVPQTKDGIKGYLSSRLIKGVGEKISELIVARFGADALSILENEPERLLEIKGITPAKLEEIKSSYVESRCLRDLMILLSPFNISPATATKIYEHFGARSVDILKNNPFELCQISSFGFKRVDAIVRKGDYALNSPMRIQGAIHATLDTERTDNGHLYLEESQLLKESYKLLNEHVLEKSKRVTPDELKTTLESMVLGGKVVKNKDRIYHTLSFVEEDETAMKIAQMLAAPPENKDISKVLESIRQELGITLSQRQSEAVYMAFRSNISIITGSPGTGKTTVLRAIIEVFGKVYPNAKIMLAAPTGRASSRLSESTGRKDAKTLHSLLGVLARGGHNTKKEKPPLDADLLIIDESSMIDMLLAMQLFKRLRPDTKVIFVGDADQLQSIGAGDVFRELINCGYIPVTVLNEIFRQKEDSLIAHNAKKINEDNTYLYYGEDFMFIKCQTQEEASDIICRQFCRQVDMAGVEKVQILSPFRTEGLAATEQLNLTLREKINPAKDENTPDLKVGNRFFRENDKVIQTKNTSKAFNGDIGFIKKIESAGNSNLKVTIDFGTGRLVKYTADDMAHIELAYAITIHKSQGSEFDTVIIPVLRNHAIMLKRNLVYTAITRAKHRVILVGDKGMLCMAIHKNDSGQRNTLLGERIGKYLTALTTEQKQKKTS